MLLEPLIIGMCAVYCRKLCVVDKLMRETDEPILVTWAELERASLTVFLWTGAGVCGLDLFVIILARALAPSGSPLVGASAVLVVALTGLILSAIRGSRAERFRKEEGLSPPVQMGFLSRLGWFAVGWFTYTLVVLVLLDPM